MRRILVLCVVVCATGGVTKNVVFEHVDGPINDDFDEAYREMYKNRPYLQPIISEPIES